MTAPFSARLRPALPTPVFARDDAWVWCPSVVRDDDGRYHLFASSWSTALPFMASYPLCSRIVRAVADRPEGPFTLVDPEVLPERDLAVWDARALHNPQVHRIGDRYALFYIGTTFAGERPRTRAELAARSDLVRTAYRGFRIGCATAPSPEGPWTRDDRPALDVRPDRWDASITTNPAVCVCADGALLMIYRANTPDGCRLGIARAERLGAPFARLSDAPILTELSLEDPFVWQDRATGVFHLVAKDLTGRVTGEHHAGVHALSTDGISWRAAPQPKAWSRTLAFADGTTRTYGHLERPYLLRDGAGEPTLLYFATAIPAGPFTAIEAENTHTWITGVPLGPP